MISVAILGFKVLFLEEVNNLPTISVQIDARYALCGIYSAMLCSHLFLSPISIPAVLFLKVKGSGIGVVGTGKGAELASSMMTFLPEVVAAVCISGCSSITASALHYGKLTIPGLCFNMSRVSISENGVFDIYEALDDPSDPANSRCRIPIEKAEGHFLFVVGEDDRNWKSTLYAEIATECLRQHGRDNFKLLSYPGAGHRINPRFSPVCLISLDRVLGVPILGGGEMSAHAYAQEHSWEKILEFLHFYLT